MTCNQLDVLEWYHWPGIDRVLCDGKFDSLETVNIRVHSFNNVDNNEEDIRQAMAKIFRCSF
jgi:hypothetical protein